MTRQKYKCHSLSHTSLMKNKQTQSIASFISKTCKSSTGLNVCGPRNAPKFDKHN